jgi:hypothetical protein
MGYVIATTVPSKAARKAHTINAGKIILRLVPEEVRGSSGSLDGIPSKGWRSETSASGGSTAIEGIFRQSQSKSLFLKRFFWWLIVVVDEDGLSLNRSFLNNRYSSGDYRHPRRDLIDWPGQSLTHISESGDGKPPVPASPDST